MILRSGRPPMLCDRDSIQAWCGTESSSHSEEQPGIINNKTAVITQTARPKYESRCFRFMSVSPIKKVSDKNLLCGPIYDFSLFVKEKRHNIGGVNLDWIPEIVYPVKSS